MICVLLVAAGGAWESPALSALSGEADIVVLKRCMDTDDLLASAAAGQADVAIVALDAPGLDGPVVEHLKRHRVRPVTVVSGGEHAWEAARSRATRLGITALVPDRDMVALVTAVRSEPPTEARAGESGSSDGDGAPSIDLDAPVAADVGSATPGRVVVVWGPHGAPGRTTVATTLAGQFAERGLPTTLVDADPHAPSVAQHLGILDEVSGLLSATRLVSSGLLEERLTTIQRALGPCLRVVTGLPRSDRWSEVRAGTIEALLEALRPRGQVVVDTGASLEDDGIDFGARPGRNALTLGALSVADEVVVVGSADPIGLSRLARGLVDLRELRAGAPVRVLLNRHRGSLGWAEADIVGMVEGFTRISGIHFLPDDQGATDKALIAGRSLIETGDSALSRAIGGVADQVLPSGAPPGKRRARRLLSLDVRRRRGGRARRR